MPKGTQLSNVAGQLEAGKCSYTGTGQAVYECSQKSKRHSSSSHPTQGQKTTRGISDSVDYESMIKPTLLFFRIMFPTWLFVVFSCKKLKLSLEPNKVLKFNEAFN